MERYLFTLGGKIRCIRCNAMSKRTKQQCLAPAIKGKTKCRTHGGKSTGPKTLQGRQLCAEARTIHGRETRKQRELRSQKLAELTLLENLARQRGQITGPKTRGRKPKSKTIGH